MRTDTKLAISVLVAAVSPSRAYSISRGTLETFPVCLLPSWTISGLEVHYSDDSTVVPGTTTFSLTSSLTNTTEDIKCDVPFKYAAIRCPIFPTLVRPRFRAE